MRIDIGGIGIEVHVEGPDDAPAVLLLHGWPDTHAVWRHQIGPLVEAGHRVIAPDLRGFGASDRPAEVADYGILSIAGDVVAMLDHLGIGRAHVVGHDWGAALSWAIGAFLPDRVDHLACLSVGHPQAFVGAGFPQREKSWYMLLFQFEDVAEQWLMADDWANLRSWSGHPEPDEVIERLAEPGALSASLNVYRANVPPASLVGPTLEFPPIAAPTLGIWSTGERHLTEVQMEGSHAYVSGPFRYERLEGAGHWMTLDAPDAVTSLLLDFLPAPA